MAIVDDYKDDFDDDDDLYEDDYKDDYDDEWLNEDDELVKRLRNLQWHQVGPELRQRCWEEFSRRIAEKQRNEELGIKEPETETSERYDFSRFAPAAREAVAQALPSRRAIRTATSLTG